VQHKLNKTGEELVADGVFGSSTHAAVVAFQAAHGLVADGVVRADMWLKLDAL
jgi:peptidoglycan hydrolase-like protein with peptidoglycan-binding domain